MVFVFFVGDVISGIWLFWAYDQVQKLWPKKHEIDNFTKNW